MLHVDLDQFIAAVEVLRHPELAGKPVIVGGRGDPTERAVVSTASYEAREFGVGSGMPLRIAARKAPEAVILPVDHEAYTAASDEVMATLRAQPGATVQVLGWDEAFVGVRDRRSRGVCADAAAGRARSHLAALQRGHRRHARAGEGRDRIRQAPRRVPPHGRQLAGRHGRPAHDRPVGGRHEDLAAPRRARRHRPSASWPPPTSAALMAEFGPRMGPWYILLGRGEGATVVDDTPWVARGHSRETTYQQDLTEPAQVEEAMRELTDRVLEDITAEGRPVIGLTLKVRYAPFMTKVFTKKVAETSDRDVVWNRVLELVARIEPDRPIRLLGLRAEMPMPEDAREGHTPTRGGW